MKSPAMMRMESHVMKCLLHGPKPNHPRFGQARHRIWIGTNLATKSQIIKAQSHPPKGSHPPIPEDGGLRPVGRMRTRPRCVSL
jgi:hypothetical protein